MLFEHRVDAGRRLGARLLHLQGEPLLVVGLPRGGVPVAFEVAQLLAAPLDVIVVRKLGVPFQPELAMGAIGEDGVRVTNPDIVGRAGLAEAELDAVDRRERHELERQAQRFRGAQQPLPMTGRTVVVVDDGIATGSTARAACQIAMARGANRVVVAVPVAPSRWTDAFENDADELVCLMTPEPFLGVGRWYDDFSPTTDEEVVTLLGRAFDG